MHVVLRGVVDTSNSTSTPLGIGGSFVGTATNILDYGFIFVTSYSDVASATDGLSAQQSSDGTNWDNTDEYTVPANKGKTYSFQPGAKWYRNIYINGAVAQTDFRLQTILKKTSSLASSHRVQDAIVDEDDAELTKSVITGKNPGGNFVNFQATAGGNFKISNEEYEPEFYIGSPLPIRLYEASGIGPAKIDKSTHAQLTVAYPHHELHDGNAYLNCVSGVQNAGGELNIGFDTANGSTWTHIIPNSRASSEARFIIWEGATLSGDTVLTPMNRNRNSNNTSINSLLLNPTVSGTSPTSGIVICAKHFGAGRTVGGEERGVVEFVLKSGTTYLLSTISEAANNDLSMNINWYEHTDKNPQF